MTPRLVVPMLLAVLAIGPAMTAAGQTSLAERTGVAMKRAAAFYRNEVSTNGGYLFEYTTDMKHRYGEMPARESQIWVQDPATPGCGQAYLSAWEATGDPLFLEAATAAARALIRGQMDCGGWNYLIDFKAGSLEDWYTKEGHHTDFNEFSHFEGNATFDDSVVRGPIMLLLRLYDRTQDPALLPPLEKALNFVLEAQFPCGGWPQRFPARDAGYDTYYTFNDRVINDNIDLLIAAYAVLPRPKYLEAALRGTDFILLSLHPGPQYGWGQQYSHDMKLAWGRLLEPPSLCPLVTIDNIRTLMDVFEVTHDRRYLEPIQSSLDWLDRSKAADGSIGTFLEEGTNRPLGAYYEGNSGSYESIRITYDLSKAMEGYGFVMKNFSTAAERKRFADLSAQAGTSAASGTPTPGVPASTGVSIPERFVRRLIPSMDSSSLSPAEAFDRMKRMEKNVEAVAGALDERGRWTQDGRLYTKGFYFKNEPQFEGPVMKNGWLRTSTFIRNMNLLAEYAALAKRAGAGK